MFEDSLMESQNRLSSPNQRWSTALSLTLQCLLAATIIALPLLHPEAMPFHVDAPRIMLPLKPLPRPDRRVDATNAASSKAAAPDLARRFTQPTRIPTLDQAISDAPPTINLQTPGWAILPGRRTLLQTPFQARVCAYALLPRTPQQKRFFTSRQGLRDAC